MCIVLEFNKYNDIKFYFLVLMSIFIFFVMALRKFFVFCILEIINFKIWV